MGNLWCPRLGVASLGPVRLVATSEALRFVADSGGAVYVWPKGSRCCAGVTYTLEAAVVPADRVFCRLHSEQGVVVWATPGLLTPTELHLEVSRRGVLRAFWNGQNWIG